MKAKTKKLKVDLQLDNLNIPLVQNLNSLEDLGEGENENQNISAEEQEERKQLIEEQREREIEKSYEEEDESDKKDWVRF